MTKIQQQIYTREREGIFSSSPGYSTIAASPGLDKSYIKQTLQPLCAYYPPQSLTNAGIREEERYPKANLITFTEMGELVIGQSVYKESDYTGERETFFSHNYIVPKDRVREYLTSADKLFGELPFRVNYDVSHGKVLNEIDALPVMKPSVQPLNQLLIELGISGKQFKQVVYAVLMSMTTKNKVYISLPSDITKATQGAYQLGYYVFQCIPFEMRKAFSMLTYHAEPQSKKHIGLMFVEKGSIRPQDSTIQRDYVFDFDQSFFLNISDDADQEPFIQFASKLVQERSRDLEHFYAYAETNLLDIANPSLTLYNELSRLYMLEMGEYRETEAKKLVLFKSFRSFLTRDNYHDKPELCEQLHALIDQESKSLTPSNLPEKELISEMIYFYSIFSRENRNPYVSFFYRVLYYGSKDLSYIGFLYSQIKAFPGLFKGVNQLVFSKNHLISIVFEPYIQNYFSRITTLDILMNEIVYWHEHTPESLENYRFQKAASAGILSLFPNEKNQLQAYRNVKKLLYADQGYVRSDDVEVFKKEVMEELSLLFIRELDLNLVSPNDLNQLTVITNRVPKVLQLGEVKWKIRVIQQAQDILQKGYPRESDRHAHQPYFTQLQMMLLKGIPDKRIVQLSELTAFCFLNKDQKQTKLYRYDDMLSYVHKNGGGLEGVRQFLFVFSRLHDGLVEEDPDYKRSVQRYLHSHAKDILENKRTLKRWQDNSQLKSFLDRVKYERMSGFRKFMYTNKKMLLSGVMLIVLTCGALTVFTMYKMNEAEKDKEVSEEAAALSPILFIKGIKAVGNQSIELQAYDKETTKIEKSSQQITISYLGYVYTLETKRVTVDKEKEIITFQRMDSSHSADIKKLVEISEKEKGQEE